MIPTAEGVLVDGCDPQFKVIQCSQSWASIKRETGRNLNRTFCGTYLVVTCEDDFPNYLTVRREIEEACRRLSLSI